jgi:PHS family inorganic phosphate transporter-like MFS transporter
MIASVFSMQGFGQLASALVALITTVAFKSAYVNVPDEGECGFECRTAADRSWRIIVGVGAIPACLALYYRITIPETPRYTFDIEHDVEKADADIKAYVSSKSQGTVDVVQHERGKRFAGRTLNVPHASWSDLISFFRQWPNFKMLLGTTLSWFFLVRPQ